MRILDEEVSFLNQELRGCAKVLSIGCGPALHEFELAQRNPDIKLIGLDLNQEMLAQSPKLPSNLKLVLGNAEKIGFQNKTFELVYFLTSLEFVSDIAKALQEKSRVLKPAGKALFIVANIKSWYVQKELREVESYIKRNLENMEPERLKQMISKYFKINSTKYMLGIREEEVFESEDPEWASLYVINARKS